jgi:plastocyanin
MSLFSRISAIGVLLLLPANSTMLSQDRPSARTVVIEVYDVGFEPAVVTVRPGDTVQFIHRTSVPHMLEFTLVPAATQLGTGIALFAGGLRYLAPAPLPRTGPLLAAPGATYEFVITEAFGLGAHHFTCPGHERMGMAGVMVVERGG